ncbi:MAG: chromate efflux transporter [Litoreibacter sp.]|nr:chromate efflux transporter [Litoreibacter sp.]MCY4333067.1 chromate efflux transporter [Litoreibacter sp.]
MSLAELTAVFWRIGVLSFGGPAAQIALMHKELVEDRPWLTEQQYLRALSFCMLLPGPEAMQLATYAGWKLRGVAGGLIAGLLFVLPGAAVIMALALGYAVLGNLPWVQALFLGIKAAVVVIVVEALIKISRRALHHGYHWALAGAAFIAIFVFSLPFPLIILAAGLIGACLPHEQTSEAPARVPFAQTLKVSVVWGFIWLAPLALIYTLDPHFLGPLGMFFSKLALVTFGGAYAVLAYMTQAVVGDLGWLTTAQMMDALGLAETTPGPLILVTEFVGVLAGYQEGGVALAILAGLVTLWVTFAPCFLWIFAGAPYIDWLSGQPRLASALSAITAAVVGVILNLSLWFALHVFFAELTSLPIGFGSVTLPILSSLIWPALLIGLVMAYLILVRKTPLHWVLLAAAICGLATQLV